MSNYVVGIDVGTTGSKAMVMDLKGSIIGKGYYEYKLDNPKPNQVTVGAKFLLDITFKCVKDAVVDSKVDPKDIKAISFSVNRGSFCLMDKDMNVIDDKMIVWLDSRSESVMDEVNKIVSPERRNEITGVPNNPVFAVTKLYWLKKNEPETLAKTKLYSSVASYIMWGFGSDNFEVELSDGTCTGLIDVKTLDWSKEIADAYGYDMKKYPPIRKSGEVVGSIKADVAAKTGLAVGTKIVSGAGDQQASAMASGVIKDGAVSLAIGTFGNLVVGLAKPNFPSFHGFMILGTPTGVFELEGGQVSGATCYRWVRDVLCAEEVEEGKKKDIDPYILMGERYINKSVPGSNGVIFYAGLFGTGYPTWDTDATGIFLGLRNTHTKADMVRSVMEGISLEARYILESVIKTGVDMEDIITLTGGAAKSKEWCQIVADIMGRKIRTLSVSDGSVLGAAQLAAIGVGFYKNVDEAVKTMSHFETIYEPIPANVEVYNKTFEVYKDAYHGLKDKDAFKKLAALRAKK
jgi:xylulokinase